MELNKIARRTLGRPFGAVTKSIDKYRMIGCPVGARIEIWGAMVELSK